MSSPAPLCKSLSAFPLSGPWDPEAEPECFYPQWCKKSKDLDEKLVGAAVQELEAREAQREHRQKVHQQRELLAAAVEKKKAAKEAAAAAKEREARKRKLDARIDDDQLKLNAAMIATQIRKREINAPTLVNEWGLETYEDDEEGLIERFFCRHWRQFLCSAWPHEPYICFLDLKPEDTINNLKAKLQTRTGVPTSDMQIVHGGLRLCDEQALCCLGLFSESVVCVVKPVQAAVLPMSVVACGGSSGCSLECRQRLQQWRRFNEVCSCCSSFSS